MPFRNYAGGGARATWSRSLRGDYSGNPLQVVCDLKVLPFVEQALDGFDDSSADLHDQPAARLQRGVGLWNEAFDHFQSCGPCENRIARFEFSDFELHLVFFRLANVRRIGYYEIEATGIETLEQIRLLEVNPILKLMAGGVGSGYF